MKDDLWELFADSDSRYIDVVGEELVKKYIELGAIRIEENELEKNVKVFTDISKIHGPQKDAKPT